MVEGLNRYKGTSLHGSVFRIAGCVPGQRLAVMARIRPHFPVAGDFTGKHSERCSALRYPKLCAAYVRLCALMCGFWENEEKRRPEGQKLFLRPDCGREPLPGQSVRFRPHLPTWPRADREDKRRVGTWRFGFSTPSAAYRRLAGERRTGKRRSHDISPPNMENHPNLPAMKGLD